MIKLSTYRDWEGRKEFKPEITDFAFGNKHRLYLDIEKAKSSKVSPSVESKLHELGFKIKDYQAGTATKGGCLSIFKIGKILNKAKCTALKNLFDSDKSRTGSNKKFKVVICRHPYDLCGMGTGRGWQSCFNVIDGNLKGKLDFEVSNANLVAYLIEESDLNIQNPSARFRLVRYTDGKHSIWKRAPLVYGEAIPEFAKTVDAWLGTVNFRGSGVFNLDAPIHKDGAPRAIVRVETMEHLNSVESLMYVEFRSIALAEIAIMRDEPSVIMAALDSELVSVDLVKIALQFVRSYAQLEVFASSKYKTELETELRILMCKFPQYYDRFNFIMDNPRSFYE